MKIKVLVLGAGKMVEAILLGLLHSRPLTDWAIYSPSGTSAEKLADLVGAQWVSDLDHVDPEWVLVGCKPQQLKELKTTIGTRFDDRLFVSMLAAVTEEDQLQILNAKKLVRVMPNLNVKNRNGVSLLSSTSAPAELTTLTSLFSTLGMAKNMTEAELEELTLLTGSGPALFYEFTKSLADSFKSLSSVEREALARQVLLGAGATVSSDETPLAELINAVTSKGGVTIAVLEKWRELRLKSVLKSGIERGFERTEELKELLRRS